MGCRFDLAQGACTGSKQGMQTPPLPVSSSPSGLPIVATLTTMDARGALLCEGSLGDPGSAERKTP